MPVTAATGPVTRLLTDEADAPDLVERLMPLVYEELRALARRQLQREYAAVTLQPTELVHEAFARLCGAADVPASSRAHFFGAAARAMRQVLVDRARARHAAKRPPPQGRIALDLAAPALAAPSVAADEEAAHVLAVHEALERLAALDPRAARVVECRFFGGLSVEETAEALDLSPRTVKRDWRDARNWLYRELTGAAPTDGAA